MFRTIIAAALLAVPGAAMAATVTFDDGATGWGFGIDMGSGESTVDLVDSDDCLSADAGARCELFSVDYFNAVNFGVGDTDAMGASYASDALDLAFDFDLDIVRTTNSPCTALGCPDTLELTLGEGVDPDVTWTGLGLELDEDTEGRLTFFYVLPPGEPDTTTLLPSVPLPAGGLLLASAGALLIGRRRLR